MICYAIDRKTLPSIKNEGNEPFGRVVARHLEMLFDHFRFMLLIWNPFAHSTSVLGRYMYSTGIEV